MRLWTSIAAVVFIPLFWLVLLGIFATGIVLLVFAPFKPFTPIAELLIVAATVFMTWLLWRAMRRRMRFTRPLRRWFALLHFAKANGLTLNPLTPVPFGGCIFGRGVNRTGKDVMQSKTGVWVGNYEYRASSAEEWGIRQWGFISIPIGTRMPHMVLKSTGRGHILKRLLPVTLVGEQVLHLEGDFDLYFTLYAPKQYERDALYIFTPDLMALFIDNASDFHVEILDDHLFVYSTKPFNMLAPATYELVDQLVRTTGSKLASRTARYSDATSSTAGFVAPQGRRLRTRASAAALVITGSWVAVQLFEVLAHVLPH